MMSRLMYRNDYSIHSYCSFPSLTSAGDFLSPDIEVITGWKCVPEAISERGDDAAGSRSRILGATTTNGFLQNLEKNSIP